MEFCCLWLSKPQKPQDCTEWWLGITPGHHCTWHQWWSLCASLHHRSLAHQLKIWGCAWVLSFFILALDLCSLSFPRGLCSVFADQALIIAWWKQKKRLCNYPADNELNSSHFARKTKRKISVTFFPTSMTGKSMWPKTAWFLDDHDTISCHMSYVQLCEKMCFWNWPHKCRTMTYNIVGFL